MGIMLYLFCVTTEQKFCVGFDHPDVQRTAIEMAEELRMEKHSKVEVLSLGDRTPGRGVIYETKNWPKAKSTVPRKRAAAANRVD